MKYISSKRWISNDCIDFSVVVTGQCVLAGRDVPSIVTGETEAAEMENEIARAGARLGKSPDPPEVGDQWKDSFAGSGIVVPLSSGAQPPTLAHFMTRSSPSGADLTISAYWVSPSCLPVRHLTVTMHW